MLPTAEPAMTSTIIATIGARTAIISTRNYRKAPNLHALPTLNMPCSPPKPCAFHENTYTTCGPQWVQRMAAGGRPKALP